MNITFVLPGLSSKPTGGFKIVFEYANRLLELPGNWNVNICFSGEGYTQGVYGFMPSWTRSFINTARALIEPRWFSLDERINKLYVEKITNETIPDADWVFATAIETVEGVSKLSSTKGVKGYLIQGFENWGVGDSAVLKSFQMGFKNVAISTWLQKVVEDASQCDCLLISNPVDIDLFKRRDDDVVDDCAVSVLYHPAKHKGFEYAWDAITIAKRRFPDLKVNMFGAFAKPLGMPRWVSYTRNASPEQLRNIYSHSSMYVCASINEGYGLTCVEAMSCSCPVVVSDFLGSREYAKDGQNALVSPAADPEAMADNICRLLTDAELRERVSAGAYESTRGLSWDVAVRRFASFLFENKSVNSSL